MKKIILVSILLSIPLLSFAQSDTKQALNSLSEPKKSQEKENTLEVPEWVKRTNVSIEAGTGMQPKYFLETIQPFFSTQNTNTVLFNQTRISGQGGRTIYNSGLGLRTLLSQYLLGVNAFYDFQDMHQHHRAGLGFEAFSEQGLEARVNSYIRVSSPRVIRDDGVNEYIEKVANGADWELGMRAPYMPFLRIYGGGYWYNYEHFANKLGWKMRMEYNPIKYSRLVFTMLNDNKRRGIDYRFEGAITLAFNTFSPKDILNDLKLSKEILPKVNLEEKKLERVVRDFDITVITKTKNKAGLIVEGGKT